MHTENSLNCLLITVAGLRRRKMIRAGTRLCLRAVIPTATSFTTSNATPDVRMASSTTSFTITTSNETPGMEICSHCQSRLVSTSKLAPNWLQKSEQPIRRQVSKLTQPLTWLQLIKFHPRIHFFFRSIHSMVTQVHIKIQDGFLCQTFEILRCLLPIEKRKNFSAIKMTFNLAVYVLGSLFSVQHELNFMLFESGIEKSFAP